MEHFKKILRRLFFLPPLLMVLIAVPAFAAVIYVLAEEISGPLTYLSYLASAYALTILGFGVPGIVRSVRRWIEYHPLTRKILSIPLSRRCIEDVKFRTEVKFRRHGSPILSTAKAISLVAALVSILSLETAMLAQFGGEDDPLFRKAMTGATGGGVCVTVLGMALFMIAKASKQLRAVLENHEKKGSEDRDHGARRRTQTG